MKNLKRFISMILCVAITATIFTGCTFFAHNYERDYSQVIVTLNGINNEEITIPAKLDEFDTVVTPEFTINYSSPDVNIYKFRLANYINQKGSEMVQQGIEPKTIVYNLLDELVDSELKLMETDKLFYSGQIFWTEEEVEQLQRAIYLYIDSEIMTFKNAVLENAELPTIEQATGEEQKPQPTYPTLSPFPEDKEDEPEEVPYYKNPVISSDNPYRWYDAWYLDRDAWFISAEENVNRIPGYNSTDLAEKSLVREAMRAYINQLVETANNLVGVDKDDVAIIKEEVKEFEKIRDTKSPEFVYPLLGSSLLMKYVVGDAYLRELKEQKRKSFIEDKALVTNSEIIAKYNSDLASQKEKYKDTAEYDKAVNAGTVILSTPSNRYVFVKHILLPFSNAETKALEDYKKMESDKEKIKSFRANLAANMKVYPIVSGEHDKYNPMTVAEVMADIYGNMARFSGVPSLAERQFDILTYRYNTDPGAFGNRTGYAVVFDRQRDAEGVLESEVYMKEFAEGARDFRRNGYSVGQLLENYVVTDYGIHVMYYCNDPVEGFTLGLDDYTTPGQFTLVKDSIEEGIKNSKLAREDEIWLAAFLRKAKDARVSILDNRLVNLYE